MKILINILFLFFFIPHLCYSTQIKQVIFFKNTQFPLIVYFLKGERPGPTIMVQGGIQGDEICGVLTAQSLLQAKVKKGNLIVVPRADLPSILLRTRGINVDLNRRFDRDYRQFYEDHLAEAIKFLVALSNGLIHLHEGSGFYDPVFISELRNPKRYGQSFIIDTKKYKENIQLEETVRSVMEKVNSKIVNKGYWFKVFNTNTLSPKTPYPEQRKSLSYYTLTKLGHPAFAIEVSKDIKNVKWKTAKQLHATQLVLKRLGVDIETGNILPYIPPKEIPRGLRVFLNGQDITFKKEITIYPFSRIWVVTPDLEFGRRMEVGIFSQDFPNIDFSRTMFLCSHKIKSLFLTIDGQKVKKWRVKTLSLLNNSKDISQQRDIFVCELNNKIILVPDKEILLAREGDRLILWGMLNGTGGEIINLKGYVSRTGPNTGQDRGNEILLDRDFFINSYIHLIEGTNIWSCDVVNEDGSAKNAKFKIIILPKTKMQIRLIQKTKQHVLFFNKHKELNLCEGRYKIYIDTLYGDKDDFVFFADSWPIKQGEDIFIKKHRKLILKIMDTSLAKYKGSIVLKGI